MLFDTRWQTKQKDEWRELLLAAADLIEKEGWVRESFHTSRGYCVVGALTAVSTRSGKSPEKAIARIVRYLRRWRLFDLNDRNTIYKWNDYKAGSGTEVVDMLRTVAHK